MKQSLNNIIACLALFFTITTVNSCGPSEKQIFNNAKQVVSNFFLEAQLNNFNEVAKIYPDLIIESYSKNILFPTNKFKYKFIDVKFNNENKTVIRVIIEISTDEINFNEKVEFFVETNNIRKLNNYKIKSTNGLFIPELRNPFETDYLFTLLNNTGYIKPYYDDYEKSFWYNQYIIHYQSLVDEIKKDIEKKLVFNTVRSDLNISNNYGYKSVNGSITIDNLNDITIPSNTYNFLLHLFKNEEKVYTHEFFTSQPIIQNSSITSKKYEIAVLPTDFNEYFSEIILKKEFLNNYIISNPEKSMRKLNGMRNYIYDLMDDYLEDK